MKYPILFQLALFFVCPLSLCGCYYAIPTIVEAVNQNQLQSESEGAILESNTGALKFVSNSDKITAEKLNAYIEEQGIKKGLAMWVLRIAAAGQKVTPGGATEILSLLGKKISMERIKKSLAKLQEL